jgi:hypothetical protein
MPQKTAVPMSWTLAACAAAALLQFIVWATSAVLPKADNQLLLFVLDIFFGYSIWLVAIALPLFFSYSSIVVFFALRGYTVWSICLIVSNYVFGFVWHLQRTKNFQWANILTFRAFEPYLDFRVLVMHLLPLFLLHMIYLWALARFKFGSRPLSL